jgi:hypothetical protein
MIEALTKFVNRAGDFWLHASAPTAPPTPRPAGGGDRPVARALAQTSGVALRGE